MSGIAVTPSAAVSSSCCDDGCCHTVAGSVISDHHLPDMSCQAACASNDFEGDWQHQHCQTYKVSTLAESDYVQTAASTASDGADTPEANHSASDAL